MSSRAPETPTLEQLKGPTPIIIELSERQLSMFHNPARLLWIGAGTKTGKTFGNEVWIADGIVRGERTAWCGPNNPKTEEAYEEVKVLLDYAEKIGEVSFNDSKRKIRARNGGLFDPYTGENPDAIFGGGYHRFVIDEASRQTQRTLTAAQTTISRTRGRIHLMFNLDKGASNWAVKGLLRVKGMSEAERAAAGEDFMFFPTSSEGWVDADYIEQARSSMPPVLFDALFNAIIPTSEVSLFRELDRVFSGAPLPGPHRDHSYVLGVDLARKQNWTVATVLDVNLKRAVDTIRFNEISWTMQYAKVLELYRRWRCSKAMVDESGIGDPVVEELRKLGMNVEGVVFTQQTRHSLIEDLVVACDSGEFTVVDDPKFATHREEMQSFEYQLGENGKVRFGVSDGRHDDCVFSLALALRGTKLGNFGTPRFARGDTSRAHVSDYSAF